MLEVSAGETGDIIIIIIIINIIFLVVRVYLPSRYHIYLFPLSLQPPFVHHYCLSLLFPLLPLSLNNIANLI